MATQSIIVIYAFKISKANCQYCVGRKGLPNENMGIKELNIIHKLW